MAQRRELYEQLAILGMFVVGVRAHLAQHPDAAMARSLRAAAKGYLVQLTIDPDTLEITAAGLSGQTGAAAGPRTPPDAPRASSEGPSPAPAPSPSPAPAAAPETSPAVAATKDIVTVGFYTRTAVGYGGSMSFLPTPIVLFKSGDALLEMSYLNDPAGLEANKRSHPRAWTKWRRVGGAIERADGSKWLKLEWTAHYDRLPKGFRLGRSYQRLSAGATFGPGGMAMASWSNLRFDRSGRFSSDSGAGAGSSSVATSSRTKTSGGTYEISGYALTLRYDDGRVMHRTIIADPQERQKVIWIDGTGYTSR
jgi:hypothetical protein